MLLFDITSSLFYENNGLESQETDLQLLFRRCKTVFGKNSPVFRFTERGPGEFCDIKR